MKNYGRLVTTFLAAVLLLSGCVTTTIKPEIQVEFAALHVGVEADHFQDLPRIG